VPRRKINPKLLPIKPELAGKKLAFLGLDPGASGGLVWFIPDPVRSCVKFTTMPETAGGVIDWIAEALSDVRYGHNDSTHEVVVGLEKVGGFMGNEAGDSGPKRNRAGAPQMFSFGRGYGVLECALAANGFHRNDASFHDVTPQAWQKSVGVKREKGEKKPAFKTRLLNRAHQLFPRTKFTKATCDAALIAWHLKHTVYGDIK